jgi:hypothetical protein
MRPIIFEAPLVNVDHNPLHYIEPNP